MDTARPLTEADGLTLPKGFDADAWIDRWNTMQQRYISERPRRLALMASLVATHRPGARRVLDLGCGPGSLAEEVLLRLPSATVVGVDLDPTLLALARARAGRWQGRLQIVTADLRRGDWLDAIGGPFDAAVSATALHWLSGDQLEDLYLRLAGVLHDGGLFLNSDHVAAAEPAEQHRRETARRTVIAAGKGDDWRGFWNALAAALKVDLQALYEKTFGPWGGIEEGLPLTWHFESLRRAGFEQCDCFWRDDVDAIYGARRKAAGT